MWEDWTLKLHRGRRKSRSVTGNDPVTHLSSTTLSDMKAPIVTSATKTNMIDLENHTEDMILMQHVLTALFTPANPQQCTKVFNCHAGLV